MSNGKAPDHDEVKIFDLYKSIDERMQNEITHYREHMDKLLGHFKWVVGIVAGGLVFLFGATFWNVVDVTAKSAASEVEEKFQSEIQRAENKAVNRAMVEIGETIQTEKESAINRALPEIKAAVDDEVSDQLTSQLQDSLNKIRDDPSKVVYIVPTGTIVAYSGADAPVGWLKCDGREISTSHTELIRIVGRNTPDLQGMFLRGAGQNSNKLFQYPGDADRQVRTTQEDEVGNHLQGTSKNSPYKAVSMVD